MANLWSDNADALIKQFDGAIKSKYKFTLSDFLTNPANFSAQESIIVTAGNIKEYVDNSIAEMLDGMEDERKRLNDDAAKCNAITSQLAQAISLEAKQNKIPLIKSDTVARDEGKDEVIYVKNASGDLMHLAERLVDSSLLIVDMTSEYNNNLIGEWLFSGNKNYVLRVNLDPNPVLNIETGAAEIDALLDAAADYIKALRAGTVK
ncbi:MAG: hypothetical protein QXK65_01535 [Candidatus Micrarchaeaceae archaeon]